MCVTERIYLQEDKTFHQLLGLLGFFFSKPVKLNFFSVALKLD